MPELSPDAPATEPRQYRITYHELPGYERERAGREVWEQLCTAAGSPSIRLGYAGMSMPEAFAFTSGELLQLGGGPFHLGPADLQALLRLVEYPPTKEDYLSPENEPDEY